MQLSVVSHLLHTYSYLDDCYKKRSKINHQDESVMPGERICSHYELDFTESFRSISEAIFTKVVLTGYQLLRN